MLYAISFSVQRYLYYSILLGILQFAFQNSIHYIYLYALIALCHLVDFCELFRYLKGYLRCLYVYVLVTGEVAFPCYKSIETTG